tara:strand:+ start:74 stop:844 length:771 start_codon:yes stop_codon:yes gene_type:complete
MKKIKYKYLLFLILLFAFLIFINKETTRKIGINYNVFEYKIPIYLKINDFFNRHYNYKFLVKKINFNQSSKEEIIINTTKWVHQNIKKIPSGVDIVDHHPLTIVQRRLGVQSQFNDILSVFFIYLDIDSFFIRMFGDISHPLTFFKIDNYWSLLDPYYGIYFINEDRDFASIEDLKTTKWEIMSLDSKNIDSMTISDLFLNNFQNYDEVKAYYKKIFKKIQSSKEIDNTNIFNRGGRSYIQKPLNRLRFEINRLYN